MKYSTFGLAFMLALVGFAACGGDDDSPGDGHASGGTVGGDGDGEASGGSGMGGAEANSTGGSASGGAAESSGGTNSTGGMTSTGGNEATGGGENDGECPAPSTAIASCTNDEMTVCTEYHAATGTAADAEAACDITNTNFAAKACDRSQNNFLGCCAQPGINADICYYGDDSLKENYETVCGLIGASNLWCTGG